MIILKIKSIYQNTIIAEIQSLDQNIEEDQILFCFVNKNVNHKMYLTGLFHKLLIKILQKIFPNLTKKEIYMNYFNDFEDYIKDYYFPKFSLNGIQFTNSLKQLDDNELKTIIERIRFDYLTKYKMEDI